MPKGLSLTELLVVMGILAILSGLAGLSFVGWQREQVLRATSREVVSILTFAKERAVNQERGTSWGVRFEHPLSGSPSFSLFQGPVFASPEGIHFLAGALTFTSPPKGTIRDVLFQTRTGRPTTATTIEIALTTSSSTKQTITVSSTGVISSD